VTPPGVGYGALFMGQRPSREQFARSNPGPAYAAGAARFFPSSLVDATASLAAMPRATREWVGADPWPAPMLPRFQGGGHFGGPSNVFGVEVPRKVPSDSTLGPDFVYPEGAWGDYFSRVGERLGSGFEAAYDHPNALIRGAAGALRDERERAATEAAELGFGGLSQFVTDLLQPDVTGWALNPAMLAGLPAAMTRANVNPKSWFQAGGKKMPEAKRESLEHLIGTETSAGVPIERVGLYTDEAGNDITGRVVSAASVTNRGQGRPTMQIGEYIDGPFEAVGRRIRSNVVRPQVFKMANPKGKTIKGSSKAADVEAGGMPISRGKPGEFITSFEVPGQHYYGRDAEYLAPTRLATIPGQNPSLRPESYGDIYGVMDPTSKSATPIDKVHFPSSKPDEYGNQKNNPLWDKIVIVPPGSPAPYPNATLLNSVEYGHRPIGAKWTGFGAKLSPVLTAEQSAKPRPGAAPVVTVRSMTPDEARLEARKGNHLYTSAQGGTIIGAPKNVRTARDVRKMRDRIDQFVNEGLEGADWYVRAGLGINTMAVPSQVVRKMYSDILAASSKQATPHENLRYMLQALTRFAAKGTVGKQLRTGALAKEIDKIFAGRGFPGGPKTGPFSRDINPDYHRTKGPGDPHFGVNDIHMGRAFDYRDTDGSPWSKGFTQPQHNFIDNETILAVERANERALGGRTDWTAEEIQAAIWVRVNAEGLTKKSRGRVTDEGKLKPSSELNWLTEEEAFLQANKTFQDAFDSFTAYATHEAVPSGITGQLVGKGGGAGLQDLPDADKLAYTRASRWHDDKGRDVIYDALGLPQTPSNEMRGIYVLNDGTVEGNPGTVAYPLVGPRTMSQGKGKPSLPPQLDEQGRALLNIAEAFRAYVDAQGAGAWHYLHSKGKPQNAFAIKHGPLNTSQVDEVARIMHKHGFGGDDGFFSNRGTSKRTGTSSSVAVSYAPLPKGKEGKTREAALLKDLDAIPGVDFDLTPIEAETGYIPFEAAWKSKSQGPLDRALGMQVGEGSSAVTYELFRVLRENAQFAPEALRKIDASPAIRRKVMRNLNRDTKFARDHGLADLKEVKLARKIIARRGLAGLRQALLDGRVLPAIAVPVLVRATQRDDRDA